MEQGLFRPTLNRYKDGLMASDKKYVEITTVIGCPVGCKKYCPQEVLTKRYGNENKILTITTFEMILKNTPKNVHFIFGAFSESLVNQNCVKFMQMASNAGHGIAINTTLYGATDETIEELKKLKYDYFSVHMPDGKVMKEPQTPNYRNNFFTLLQSISNLSMMTMNSQFETNNRENVVRGLAKKIRPYGYCIKFNDNIQPVIMPNGDAYLCCQDFGLRHKVGNLASESYEKIVDRIRRNEGKFSECMYCVNNKSRIKHLFWRYFEKTRFFVNPLSRSN
jgi:hypothetical protein